MAAAAERFVVQVTTQPKKAIAAKAKKVGPPISEVLLPGATSCRCHRFQRHTRHAPTCLRCKKSDVRFALALHDAVVWSCPRCNAAGRVSNGQGALWNPGGCQDGSR